MLFLARADIPPIPKGELSMPEQLKDRPEIPVDQPDAEQSASPVNPDAENGNNANNNVDARTRANRENAKKSTGPRTDAGREASSKNAAKHGLFAADVSKYLRTEEESQRYERFIDGMVRDLRPVGDYENILARRAADIQFRLEVLRTAEFKVYGNVGLVKDTMEAYLNRSGGRYSDPNPAALVSLYDSRFQRAFDLTMKELLRTQAKRKEDEEREFNEAKGIVLAHMQQDQPFDPAEFGFVISTEVLYQKVRLAQAKKMVQFCKGDGKVEKQIVDYLAKKPKKAA
jgi:hypothetical protein